MAMQNDATYKVLTAAGVLPFVAGAIVPLAGIHTVLPFGDLHALVGSYGLAIVSFLAGTHWAVQLLAPAKSPFDLFVASNAIFLATWFAYIFLSLPWALLVQALALLALLHVDRKLRAAGLTSDRYFATRTGATLAASISLVVIFVTS